MKVANLSNRTHYDWLKADEVYSADFDLAQEHLADAIEGAFHERAVHGTVKPTGWYKGEPGGFIREFDTTAGIVMLKGLRPDRYADRKTIDIDINDKRSTAQIQAKLAALLDRNPDVKAELIALADPRDETIIEGEFSEGGEPPIDGRACVKDLSPVSGDSAASKLLGPSVGGNEPLGSGVARTDLPGADLYSKG